MNMLQEKASDLLYEYSAALVLTEDDPQSIYKLVPEWLADKIRKIPKEYWDLSTEDLRRKVRPGKVVETLRYSFWLEYNATVFQGKKGIVLQRVYGPICTDVYFGNEVCNSPLLLCWMLHPPQNYTNCLEALLDHSLERVREIVNLPIVDEETKKVDHKIAKMIIDIHDKLQDRLKGTVVQRLETKNMNLNLNRPVTEITEEQLDRRLKELQRAERNLLGELARESSGETTEASGD